VNTISAKAFEVNEKNLLNGKTWWEARPYMILMPVESWEKIKSFIIKICKKSNKCSGPSLSKWERTVNIMDKSLKASQGSK